MLATYLSLQEIAGQLSLSRATVKAQATSIYRKLGTSTRSQAVTRVRDLGLLEPVHGLLEPRYLAHAPPLAANHHSTSRRGGFHRLDGMKDRPSPGSSRSSRDRATV